MTLTDDDIKAIAAVVEEKHICRYDIAPKDMSDLLAFVRSFHEGAIETSKAFRSTIIKFIVWGTIAGFIALLEAKFKWIRPLLRFVTGAQG